MADYFPVLSRAVAGLENNTGEARRAVYERARSAIVKQLRAIDPPLSEDDIGRERMQLEEAIRRVEANAGGSPATPRSAAPPAQPARPAPQPQPRQDAAPEQPKAAARPALAQRPAPETADPTPKPRGPARPAKRPDGRPIIPAKNQGGKDGGSKRSGLLVGGVALALILICGGLFLARGQIGSLFGGKNAEVAKTEQPADAAKKPDENASKPAEAGKSDDRLPQDGAQSDPQPANPPAAQNEQPPQGQPEQPKADQPAPEQQANLQQPPAQAPTPPAAEPAPTPQAQQPSQGGPLVAQRAVLYEEGSNQQSGEAVTGTVVWRTESVSGGQNQPLETAVRGEVEIPGRKLKATLVIRRNADATLPASHTIEIQFNLPENFSNAGISNVPGVLMKADESARGAAVAGLSVRVTSGFFLIGLSNLDTERPVNEQLLRDRGWLDIPILYDNGRRAVLTLEKGTPGTQAFNDAFNAWKTSATAGGQQPQQN